jgi:hypothetical protein
MIHSAVFEQVVDCSSIVQDLHHIVFLYQSINIIIGENDAKDEK